MSSENKLSQFVRLLDSGDRSKACAAFNEGCDNECHTCPFGSDENYEALSTGFKVLNLLHGDLFNANEESGE